MSPSDPYKTQPLAPITQALVRPVRAPLVGALIALPPALLVAAALLLWGVLGRAAPQPVLLIATPTLGLPGLAPSAPALPRAAVAYDAPGGAVVGALESGRAYAVTARSGLAWVQLDVARPGEPANLVWVTAADLPEVAVAAIPVDMATPAPSATPQVVYVYVPAPVGAAPAPLAELPAPPAPTSAYLIPPATPAPRPVVFRAQPTAPPCTLRELGSVLRVCNGVTP